MSVTSCNFICIVFFYYKRCSYLKKRIEKYISVRVTLLIEQVSLTTKFIELPELQSASRGVFRSPSSYVDRQKVYSNHPHFQFHPSGDNVTWKPLVVECKFRSRRYRIGATRRELAAEFSWCSSLSALAYRA